MTGDVYEQPLLRTAGDRCVLVEFGRAMSLDLNFRAQGLAQAIAREKVRGIVDASPCFATLLVEYEADEISPESVRRSLLDLYAAMSSASSTLESRLFYIPVMYLDPWTRDCVEQYSRTIAPRQYDPEQMAGTLGLPDARAVVRTHASSEWWIAAIGSWPGLPFCMALDPRCNLTAPKYNPPRTHTPRGAIGLGGASTAIYSVESPGGYQLLGRTPVPIFEPSQRLPAFERDAVLLRAGDRIRFVPIDREEYDYIDACVRDGTYRHDRIDYQAFSVVEYYSWRARVATGNLA